MKTFQRILAVVLALVMSLSVIGVAAFATTVETTATIDTTKTGSITVYKYEYNGTNTNNKGTGLKSESNNLPKDDSALDDPSKTAIALEGVTFKIYQVKNTEDTIAYYNGEATDSVTVASFLDDGKIKSVYSEYAQEQTTGKNGEVAFTNLPVGMYVIVESAAPENVTKAVEPFLVSIPMTHPTNLGEWMYDVYVYPKNSTSEGNVILYKKNESGDVLGGVEFKLEKADSEPVTVTTTWTDQDKNQTTDSNGKVEWESLAHGTYRITEVSAPAGYIVDQRPIVFTVTKDNKITCTDTRACINVIGSGEKTLTITLKNEKPNATKEITEVNSKTVSNTDGSAVKEANASVGDVITYKVTVDVPANIKDLKTFTVTDTPTNLQYKEVTSVKCGDATVTCTAEAVDKGFKIEFTPSAMGDYAGNKIVITYKATVLSTAADATAAPNTATLTYSNKIKTDSTEPDGDDDKYDIEDGAVVYTYKLGVIKYKDKVESGNELPNVEFKLYTTATGGTALSVVEEVVGTYRLATSTDTTITTTLKTDANGKIVVKGLANGTYYLEETKTVDGYNLLKGRVAVELQISTKTSWNEKTSYENGVWTKKTYVSATHTSADGDDATTDLLNTTIINKKGFDLPETGGIGTLMFFIIGGVLIAGGICLITVPNKKRSV